jgi:hypothetical protein
MTILKCNFKNKNGNIVVEAIIIMVSIFLLAMGVYAVYPMFAQTVTTMEEGDFLGNTSTTMLDEQVSAFPFIWDAVIVLAFVFLWIGALVSAYYIDTDPVFFVISIILGIIALVVGAFLSNTYETLMSSSSTLFPMSSFLMGHLVAVALVYIISIGIVLYARASR